MTEQQLHIQIAGFLRSCLYDTAMFFHTPMAAKRSVAEGARFKKMGSTAGIPDITVLYQGRAIFIELKAAKGRLSPAQIATAHRIEKAGCPVYECRSLEHVVDTLTREGVPLRTCDAVTEALARLPAMMREAAE